MCAVFQYRGNWLNNTSFHLLFPFVSAGVERGIHESQYTHGIPPPPYRIIIEKDIVHSDLLFGGKIFYASVKETGENSIFVGFLCA